MLRTVSALLIERLLSFTSLTLTKEVGQRSIVTEYYSVQVKSNDDPWDFKTGDEIQWLFDHPTLPPGRTARAPGVQLGASAYCPRVALLGSRTASRRPKCRHSN
jgi:hypothetical protein